MISNLLQNPLLIPVWSAIFCGLIIGFEREIKGKPLGISTSLFICVGSAVFTWISLNIPNVEDTSRVIAQIVNGIGFLGAGTIIFTKNKLRGLTSASIVWVTAAVGILCGLDLTNEAFLVTITLIVLDILLSKIKWTIRKKKAKDDEEW